MRSCRSGCCARTAGGRVPAVEVLLNTKLVSELIDKGDFTAIKEAMEKSLAEGSQTFEEDIARLISDGLVTRDEGLSHADSPTNLLWRLQNDQTPIARRTGRRARSPTPPSFTEITLDVVADSPTTRSAPLTRR